MYARTEIDQMVEYQKTGFWSDFNYSYTPLHDIGSARTLIFFIDPNSVLSSSLLETVKQNLYKWGAVADIQFVQTYTEAEANIVFNEKFFSTSEGGTSFTKSDPNSLYIDQAIIEVSSAFILDASPERLFDTFVHETGHALGLGHPGNYNGSASFNDASFVCQ